MAIVTDRVAFALKADPRVIEATEGTRALTAKMFVEDELNMIEDYFLVQRMLSSAIDEWVAALRASGKLEFE